MEKETIAVWFSCGAASAVAAKLIVDKYRDTHNIFIVNTEIKEEDKDNQRFLKDVEKWIAHPIIHAGNKLFPNNSIIEVFDKRQYMSGIHGAPCTGVLKKEARYQFELEHDIDWHVLGFTLEEKKRQEKFNKFERGNTINILIDERVTKNDCFEIIKLAGIELPYIYSLGFPNANCIGCVKSQSPTYWNLVRRWFLDTFNQRAEQSRRIGCRLVKCHAKYLPFAELIDGMYRNKETLKMLSYVNKKGKIVHTVRIFLDELPIDAKGGKIKSYECGIFCDTK